MLLTYPLMVGIQLASARIGRTTGRGLTSAFASLWPRPVVAVAVMLLLIANVINLAADLGAMAEVTRLAIGGPEALMRWPSASFPSACRRGCRITATFAC